VKPVPRQRPFGRRTVAELTVLALVIVHLAGQPSIVFALSPDSPQVKAAVQKGLKYLSAQDDARTGARALAAMALAKNDAPANHPVIQRAVRHIRGELANNEGDFNGSEQIYHMGLALIFLASTDGDMYRKEIDQLVARLVRAQKPHGGWGYPNQGTGDTSMTQYGVLGFWEADRAGANTPWQSWERVGSWLLRTQDPGGGFGYQGIDPGHFNLVKQDEVRQSLSAAGLGSLYICADQFGLNSSGQAKKDEKEKPLPSALKPVKSKDTARQGRKPDNVDATRVKNAMGLGNRWFDKNFTTNPSQWQHYYYYAYERYRSFRELAEGDSPEEPKWYTDIANQLLRTQGTDGSWTGQTGSVVDTAFSVLFLSRSTKKSIVKALGAGTLVGGRGLPTDADKVAMRLGNVVRKPLSGPADKLLSIMENSQDPDFLAAVEGFAEKTLEPDDAQLPEHLVRLKKLAGGDSPAARAVALRALAATGDLNHAPLLIFALQDSDWGVVRAARDGLRRLSRKFEQLGPEIPYQEDYDRDHIETQRRKAIEAWKAWYRSVRPEYVFED
jgi:hypothetical protein